MQAEKRFNWRSMPSKFPELRCPGAESGASGAPQPAQDMNMPPSMLIV